MSRLSISLSCVLGLVVACGETGQNVVDLPVYGAAVAASIPFEVPSRLPAMCAAPCACELGTWTVTLERAEVGFGPLTVCANQRANPEQCADGVGELLAVGTIDARNPALQPLGIGAALTVEGLSSMWDYGLPWLLTQAEPTPQPGAPEGHSLVLRGSAQKGATTLFFAADIDVIGSGPGLPAVQGVSTPHVFTDTPQALVVRVDAAAWTARIDFDALACARADVTETRVTIAPGSIDYTALVQAMTASQLPTIRFEPVPVR